MPKTVGCNVAARKQVGMEMEMIGREKGMLVPRCSPFRPIVRSFPSAIYQDRT